MTIGDFLHYGDGPTEASQNRYGLSAVVEGTRQPVGLWMEGLREPLWGDTFGPGWVDLTEIYRRHQPRFVVVYAHGKAEAYYLPEAADQLLVHNAATRPPGVDGYRGWTALQVRHRVGRMLTPGATYRSPPVYTYLMRAPLFSADADTVPDVLQSLLPLWTDLVEASRHHGSLASLRAELDARPDRQHAGWLARLLQTALEPDDTSIALQAAWMAAADRMADLAAAASNPDERRELERRTLLIRENALRGAHDSLTTLIELRGRSDLMPTYGIGSNHGFHVLVFDWAYRMTGDARFRAALLSLADQISTPEARGGLQVADASKPNFGGFILNERARAQGSNNLDDQGIKLWALRVAYERTGRRRYRRSAELFIDHWIKVRADDHQFFGITRLFDRYARTGAEQQMTSLGHNSLLIGLAAWADLHPRAARLRAEGMKNVTERHPVDAVGTTGALEGGAVVRFEPGPLRHGHGSGEHVPPGHDLRSRLAHGPLARATGQVASIPHLRRGIGKGKTSLAFTSARSWWMRPLGPFLVAAVVLAGRAGSGSPSALARGAVAEPDVELDVGRDAGPLGAAAASPGRTATLADLRARYNPLLLQGLVRLRARQTASGGAAADAIPGDNTDAAGMRWTKCTNLGLDLLATLVAEAQGLIDRLRGARAGAQGPGGPRRAADAPRDLSGDRPARRWAAGRGQGGPHPLLVDRLGLGHGGPDAGAGPLPERRRERGDRPGRPRRRPRVGPGLRRLRWIRRAPRRRLLGGRQDPPGRRAIRLFLRRRKQRSAAPGPRAGGAGKTAERRPSTRCASAGP